MKKIAAISISIALATSLAGCAGAPAFGGKCDVLKPAAVDALDILTDMDSVISEGIDTKQKTAWDAGYEYLGQWSTKLDEAEGPLQDEVDTEDLTDEESALLSRFSDSIKQSSALTFTMFSTQADWYNGQKEDLNTIIESCK